MAGRLYGASGTLVGAPVVLNIQTANNWTAEYVEVHNLSAANTYTCTVNGATFSIPSGRKLAIPGYIADLTLNGTGAYSMYAAESSDTLPSLDNISQGSIGSPGSISPPDNVTLEDTGTVLQVKNLGVSTAKVAAQAINTSKLADLAVNFNKTGSGVHQNPGQGASFLIDCTTAIVTDTVAITFNGVAVTYEFTNGGAPGPGNIGVDLPTINVDFPIKVAANQPLISFSMTAGIGFCGISNQALVQAGTTLSAAVSGTQVVTNLAATAESRTGIEFRTLTVDANMAANYAPIYYTGTLLFALVFSSTAGDIQLTPIGLGYLPLATGDGIAVSTGVAGTKLHVILFMQY